MAELGIDEELPPEYWEAIGEEPLNQTRTSPFDEPPAADQDPFAPHAHSDGGSRSRYEAPWLRTYKGIEFIDVFVGELPDNDDTHALIFLHEPAPGRWGVGVCRPKTVVGGRFIVKDVDYETAKQKAERAAMTMSVDAGLNADWRHDPASLGQLGLIRRIFGDQIQGMAVDNLSKGEASDLLNVHFSSKTLDSAFARST